MGCSGASTDLGASNRWPHPPTCLKLQEGYNIARRAELTSTQIQERSYLIRDLSAAYRRLAETTQQSRMRNSGPFVELDRWQWSSPAPPSALIPLQICVYKKHVEAGVNAASQVSNAPQQGEHSMEPLLNREPVLFRSGSRGQSKITHGIRTRRSKTVT